MTTYAWPTADYVFAPTRMEIGPLNNNRMAVSPLSGYTQTASIPGTRWSPTLAFGSHAYSERQRLEGYLARLSGNEHRAQLFDHARPVPLGTINLSGVTASAAAQFASTITLNGCGNTKTLKAGDWFSVVTAAGVQLVMCAADASSDAGGVMSVEFRHMLRAAVSAAAAVVLDHPVALYILADPNWRAPRAAGNEAPGFEVSFVEVFA